MFLFFAYKSFFKLTVFIRNARITEAVGTFKNGILSGIGKVKFESNMTLISNFENGIPMGIRRLWDNGNLTSFRYAEGHSLLSKSKCWKFFSKYQRKFLIFTDCSFIKEEDNYLFSVLVPLNVTEEILVGKIDLKAGSVDDVYSAEIQITSKKGECMLMLDWTLKEPKDFKISLFKKNGYIPINGYKTKPMCTINETENAKPEEKLMAWEFITAKNFENDITNNAFEVLSYVKPEESSMDIKKVKKSFLSNVTIFMEDEKIYVNMSHWQGPILKWVPESFSMDTDGLIHGVCNFDLTRAEDMNKTGSPDFIDWRIKFFSGRFVHGKLQGMVLMMTWDGAIIFSTFKDGELHGPAFALGRIPIYDIGVSFYFIQTFISIHNL